jgi:hypothetical protein
MVKPYGTARYWWGSGASRFSASIHYDNHGRPFALPWHVVNAAAMGLNMLLEIVNKVYLETVGTTHNGDTWWCSEAYETQHNLKVYFTNKEQHDVDYYHVKNTIKLSRVPIYTKC